MAAVAIVFGPNSQIPSPLLCINANQTDCIAAVGTLDATPARAFVPPHIANAPHSGDVVIKPPISFFASQVAKDTTLRFEFSNPRVIETFYLFFRHQSSPTGNATPWAAVVEDNVIFEAAARSAWMETLASTQPYEPNNNLNQARGHYPDSCTPPYSDTLIPERNQWQPPSDTVVCGANAAWYKDPFRMPRRHWSIGEVTVEGLQYKLADDGVGRRADPTPPSTVEELMASLHHRSWAPKSERRIKTVQNALRARPLVDTQHSPFPREIKTMPVPALETRIGCGRSPNLK